MPSRFQCQPQIYRQIDTQYSVLCAVVSQQTEKTKEAKGNIIRAWKMEDGRQKKNESGVWRRLYLGCIGCRYNRVIHGL